MNHHGGYFGEESVTDFSVNINILPHPKRIRQIYQESFDAIRHYPKPDYCFLKEALGAFWKRPVEEVLVGNGASELILLLARVRKPQRVLIIEPTYTEYARAFRGVGSRVESLILTEKEQFRLNPDRLKEHSFDLLILCNPNNPTGILYGTEELRAIHRVVWEKKARMLIDESFLDFTREKPTLWEPDLLHLRSLTKILGMAGLRLGALLSSETEKLAWYQEPWSVNVIADLLACPLLQEEDFFQQTLVWKEEESNRFRESLPQRRLFGGDANFFLLRPEKEVAERLLRRGFFLRRCGDFPGLSQQDLRFCLRSKRENIALIQALKEEGC